MKNQQPQKNDQSLPIGDLIRRIQNDLIESQRQRESEGQPPLFEVDSLTLEVHFVVTRSTKTTGGFDLKVITFGGETTYTSEQVHKISLSLKSAPQEEADFGLSGLDIESSGRRPRRR